MTCKGGLRRQPTGHDGRNQHHKKQDKSAGDIGFGKLIPSFSPVSICGTTTANSPSQYIQPISIWITTIPLVIYGISHHLIVRVKRLSKLTKYILNFIFNVTL